MGEHWLASFALLALTARTEARAGRLPRNGKGPRRGGRSGSHAPGSRWRGKHGPGHHDGPCPRTLVTPPEPHLTRRAVLQSAGVVAAGGIGLAAGFGLRGLVEPAVPAGPVPADQRAAWARRRRDRVARAVRRAAGRAAGRRRRGPRHAFRSRPDLAPPVLLVGSRTTGTAPGHLFTTPNNGEASDGPTIYDEAGQPVWVRAGTGTRGIAGGRPTSTSSSGPAGRPSRGGRARRSSASATAPT